MIDRAKKNCKHATIVLGNQSCLQSAHYFCIHRSFYDRCAKRIFVTTYRNILQHWRHSQCLVQFQLLLCKDMVTVHIVYFVKYDDAVSFMTLYPIQQEEGVDRAIITEERVDTVTYFGGNHGPRVWKSLKLEKVYFLCTRTSWDKYMFNRKVFSKF